MCNNCPGTYYREKIKGRAHIEPLPFFILTPLRNHYRMEGEVITMEKPKLVAFTLRIPEEVKLQLDMLATQQDRSTNNLILTILKGYLQNVKKMGHTK